MGIRSLIPFISEGLWGLIQTIPRAGSPSSPFQLLPWEEESPIRGLCAECLKDQRTVSQLLCAVPWVRHWHTRGIAPGLGVSVAVPAVGWILAGAKEESNSR